MVGELRKLRLFVHQLLRLPRERRGDAAAVLKVLLPDVYGSLIADLADYPLSTVLPVAAMVMQVPELEKPWFFGLVRELHTRSMEIRRRAPACESDPPAPGIETA